MIVANGALGGWVDVVSHYMPANYNMCVTRCAESAIFHVRAVDVRVQCRGLPFTGPGGSIGSSRV